MAQPLTEKRPNPDSLLERVEAEEERHARGKLKIFFGASAGVGKTYAMLEVARSRRASSLDVVAGIIETHGRKETEALLHGLEILPPKFIEYKTTKLREFDLEGALRRRPALILVDELAHTNAPGSKNAKRWQDVQELLNAGIDVFATLNVQHVESLNDVVAQITGIVVRETVPDAVVENADESELIDLPPDDLLKRLSEGKVYIPDQAERAAGNFFRKGNLIALRELALRKTADRVNDQAQSYRSEQSIKGPWPTRERILVCVGPSPFSGRLVRAARRMAAGLHAEWIAATVESATLSEADRQQVNRHLRLAEQLGAESATLSGQHVAEQLIEYARSRNVTKIIAGKPAQPKWKDRLFGSFVDDLIRRSGDIDVHVIKGDADDSIQRPEFAIQGTIEWPRYGWSAAIVAICTLVGSAMHPHFELSNIIMVYLLGVVAIAARWGRGPAIFASVASVGAFDFFFVPPQWTFAVSDSQYLVTFAVMLVVALIISSLTVKIQQQATSSMLREQRTAALYAMARQLSNARGTKTLLEIAVRHISEVFDATAVGLLPNEIGRLNVEAGNASTFDLTPRERGVAQWVFDVGRSAGMGTDTLPGAEATYVPLNATRGPVGVIGITPRRAGGALSPGQLQLLETFVAQAALSIESDRFADEAKQAQIDANAEKSRSALLSSVSHDLRTPLAAISGAASSLIHNAGRLDTKAKNDLAETISDEAQRMTRLVSNLLEMTRLESGAAIIKKEPCPLDEVVGSALTRLERTLTGRQVNTAIPRDLPLIPMDVVLMEQVFMNLLENAAKYTPADTSIYIVANATQQTVNITVADRGPGIIPGDEKKIFDKFYRSENRQYSSGVGLGLAICRAIVEAHGGTITAENRNDGGAVFNISLPLSS